MKKRLRLKKVTIRDLDEAILQQMAGGATEGNTCFNTCPLSCCGPTAAGGATCGGTSCNYTACGACATQMTCWGSYCTVQTGIACC